MPPTGSWSTDETFHYFSVFLRLPVNRSPHFPVFFYTGRRTPVSPNRQQFRFCKHEIQQTDLSSLVYPISAQLEDNTMRELARLISQVNDGLHADALLAGALPRAGYQSESTFMYRTISKFVSPFKLAIIYNAMGSLKGIFKRKRGNNPEQKVKQTHIAEQNPATSALPAHSQPIHTPNRSPDMRLNTSYEEFTPVITPDFDDETYRFQCSSPGLYLCSVTSLMFGMKGEGDVVYRIVPWNRRLLVQHHKKPAGPLFDITCVQQCVSQLHLPHCEISSTGGAQFLSVAHVTDDGDVEFIGPQKVTETHVVISITGFSAYGNVKDENSPPDPVRALVLLFYRPPADPDPESQINVLLLPKNVSLTHVLRTRKKLVGDETFIETSSECKLKPNQVYTLSTCPQDDSIEVQPTEADFDCGNYDNYVPSFQVILENIMKTIRLLLTDTDSSLTVWERRVCLSSSGTRKSCRQSTLNLPSNDRLLHVRSSFVDGISEPVLNSLLDKLLEKKVITDSEKDSVNAPQNKRDKARVVIDTVRKKGEAASSEMIDFLCELDTFLCEHLDLI